MEHNIPQELLTSATLIIIRSFGILEHFNVKGHMLNPHYRNLTSGIVV